jgi:hypothetical protein
MDRDWTASFSIRFRNGTCIIILDKKYNIANSSCHFGSYGSIWTGPSPTKYYMDLRSFGPYNMFLVTDRSVYCHMTLSAMNYLLYIVHLICSNLLHQFVITGGSRVPDRMVVGLTITYAISAYIQWSSKPVHGEVYSIQHLCDKVCQWLETGRWFSPGTLVSSTNKTDCHNITEILMKVGLNTISHHTPKLHLDSPKNH